MKIILSRKGFDSGFGGNSSVIMPDGTLVSILERAMVKPGDIFLFFGWFKQSRLNDEQLLLDNNQDYHLIYGYLQIEKMYKPISIQGSICLTPEPYLTGSTITHI